MTARYACYRACSGRPRHKLPGDYSIWLGEQMREFYTVDPGAFNSTPTWVLDKYGLPVEPPTLVDDAAFDTWLIGPNP